MALVLSIERCSLNDGPGIRSTVFLKGCPLNCKWCHNPESISFSPTLAFIKERCTLCGKCESVCPADVHTVFSNTHIVWYENCVSCGNCVKECPNNALKIYGEELTSEQVFLKVMKDEAYYRKSGGGVTVSGGEPAMHPEFVEKLFKMLKKEKIHTCLETSGYAEPRIFERLSEVTDLFLFDCKADSSLHEKLTGVSNDLIGKNLDFLCSKKVPVILRCPMIPGVNDTDMHFEEILSYSSRDNIIGVEILPYHLLGKVKAEQIGREYEVSVPEPDKGIIERWKKCLSGCGKLIGTLNEQ